MWWFWGKKKPTPKKKKKKRRTRGRNSDQVPDYLKGVDQPEKDDPMRDSSYLNLSMKEARRMERAHGNRWGRAVAEGDAEEWDDHEVGELESEVSMFSGSITGMLFAPFRSLAQGHMLAPIMVVLMAVAFGFFIISGVFKGLFDKALF